MYKLEDYIIDSREEAHRVLDCLLENVRSFGFVTVTDYKDMLGVDSEFGDINYGWTEETLYKSSVRITTRIQHSSGYIIRLPKPEYLPQPAKEYHSVESETTPMPPVVYTLEYITQFMYVAREPVHENGVLAFETLPEAERYLVSQGFKKSKIQPVNHTEYFSFLERDTGIIFVAIRPIHLFKGGL